VPEYGYEPTNITFTRKAFEYFFGFTVWFFHLPLTIWTLEHLPVSLMGPLFVRVRKIWKRSTKTSKTRGLDTLTFRLMPLDNISSP
jgi:hypothetical protein